MRLTSDVVLYELRNSNMIRCRGFDGLEFAGVRLTPEDDGFLCVCPGAEVTAAAAATGCAFISVGEPAFQPERCVVLAGSQRLAEIHTRIQALFDRFAAYDTELARAALQPGYGAMIHLAWEMSHNPVIFMDGSLRVLELAPDWDYADDAEWTHMRRYGFASLEGLRSMRESGEFSTLLQYKDPVLYGTGTFSNPSIVSTINIDGVCAARICMTGPYEELTPFDLQGVGILAEHVERKIRLDDSFRKGTENDPVYSILFDLIRGMKLESRLITNRLGGLLGWKDGQYCVLVIPAAGTDEISYNYYSGLLSRQLDCFCVRYESGLVAVIHLETGGNREASHGSLAEFLQKNGMTGGMSNWFEDITRLKDYYEQALVSLQYHGEAPGLHTFSSCAMEHMLGFFPPERLATLIHPALLTLREHDRSAGTELFETLRAYLENERSLVKTAAALFIHRNTLLYRLEKLGQLVELDLDDSELRLYLMLSFRLLGLE